MSALERFDPASVPLEGTCLIEAGAGTGKTYAIASLYLRLLLERRLDVSQILVVTYTVAATSELRDRIRTRLVGLAAALDGGALTADRTVDGVDRPDADLVRTRLAAGDVAGDREHVLAALRNFDRAAIFTIHGFCQRVLSEHAFESGSAFDSELVSDQSALLEEVAGDFFVRELYDASPQLAAYAAKDGFERLLELAERVASRRDVVVNPPRPAIPDMTVLQARWRDALTRAEACFAEHGEQVFDALLDAGKRGVIKKGMYQNATMRKSWLPGLEAVFALQEPGVEKTFQYFERLCVSGLQSHWIDPAKGPLPKHELFDLCQDLLEADRGYFQSLTDWRSALEQDFVDYARAELTSRKQEQGVLFFDDLLDQLGAALAGAGGERLARAVRRRHPVALIDEFQDTDRVQYAIFRQIWDDRNNGNNEENADDAGKAAAPPALFLIGDPKQAIYAFRGADVATYLEAAGRAERRYGLTTNYRSDPALVDALNATFSHARVPFGDDAISYEPVRAREHAEDAVGAGRIASGLRVLFAGTGKADKKTPSRTRDDLVRDVASEIARLLASETRIGDRRVEAGDIAVLTRTNQQARLFQSGLRRHGIASVLLSEESVFATEEAVELDRVMRAMAEPEHPARLRAALATTLLSASADDLRSLLDEDSAAGAAAWEEWGARFRRCRRRWVERGFIQALRLLWMEGRVGPRLLARTDGERRVTNLLHLAELLQRAAVEGRLGPLALVYWFGRRRIEAGEARKWVAEDAQLRLESDDRAVKLVTVHRSKGLEYPITFCPYLWEGTLIQDREKFPRFHDPETGALALDLVKGPERESFRLAQREAFAESLRLLYVALTRAEHHCSVVWGTLDSKAGTSPLGHVLHPLPIPPPLPRPQPQPEREPGLPDAARFAGRDEADLGEELATLAAQAPGRLCIESLDATPGPVVPAQGLEAAADELRHRVARRSFANGWRVSSFSGLVSTAPRHGPSELGGASHETLEAEEGRDYADPDLRVAGRVDGDSVPVRLADFPAGAGPGILVHEIFEKIDFTGARAGEIEERTVAALTGHGLAVSLADPLVTAIREVLATPLEPGDGASRLAAVTREERVDEMPFMLPAGDAARPISPADLSAVFDRHATRELSRRYAQRAATLAFPPLEGHLRGFIDLVFCRDERWYVVDYKSNHLGRFASDYAASALDACMLEHDYVLQYHLYLVALHRHLRLRLPGYDYDRHLGGAYYLFLRGMSPQHPPGCGVLHDRPPRALIDALSDLLGEGEA